VKGVPLSPKNVLEEWREKSQVSKGNLRFLTLTTESSSAKMM